MPLELGLFLGAKYYGGSQGAKACVIFDRDRYRYQIFCSDLAGHDIRAHGAEEREVIRGVRDAVRTSTPGRALPGAAAMYERYREFVTALPVLAQRIHLHPDALTFSDLVALTSEWLRLSRPSAISGDPAAG